MTTLVTDPPRHRLSWTRRVIGTIVCLGWLALVLAYIATHLMHENLFLRSHFDNSLTGLGIVLLITIAASVVLMPVRNSTTQGGRQVFRFVVLALAAVSFIGAGLAHGFGFFKYQSSLVGTSPDGTRRVALVTVSQSAPELHVWAGTGLSAKIMGSIGQPCQFDHVKFISDSEFIVSTSFGDYDIHLAPDGRPLNPLTHTCSV